MWTGDIFLITLTIGVLSRSMVRPEAVPKNQIMASHLRALGYTSVTIKDIEDFDAKMCMKVGGPNTYEIFEKNFEYFANCIGTVGDEIEKELKSETYTSNSLRELVSLDKTCQRVSQFEYCLKNFTDSLKICLDEERHETVGILYNSVSSVLRYVCQNRAAQLKDSEVTECPSKCFEANGDAFMNCANQTIIKYIRKTVIDGASIGGLGALNLLVPDLEKCTAMEELQHCVVDVINDKCATASNFVSGVYNVLGKATTCNKILKN